MGANFHCIEKQPFCVLYRVVWLPRTFKVLYKKSTNTVDRPLTKAHMVPSLHTKTRRQMLR